MNPTKSEKQPPLRLRLVQGSLVSWPCDAVLCNVSQDELVTSSCDGASKKPLWAQSGSDAHMLLERAPGLVSTLKSRRSWDCKPGSIFKTVAEGAIPTIYVYWANSPDPKKKADQEDIHSQEVAWLLETLLRSMYKASLIEGRRRLAMPALLTNQNSKLALCTAARVFVNALLLFRRHSFKPLEEIAIIASNTTDLDAYRQAFRRLAACQERCKFFQSIDHNLLTETCPQPSRQAPVKKLGDDVLSDRSVPLLGQRRRELAVGHAGIAFAVDQFLSKQECLHLIAAAEGAGLDSVSWEYDPKYRDCRRAIFHDTKAAGELWRRLLPLLCRDDLHEVRPIGWGTDGVWAPYGVNECLRISRYDVGGHFAMHRDGPFVLNDDKRSIFTILVYLNDEFEGGETAFDKGIPDGTLKEMFKPSIGAATIFTHDIRHQGCEVTVGAKYVLRTDLMFRRVDSLSIERHCCYLSDPKYRHCESLYRESIRLQNESDVQGSTEKYLEALELQAGLASVRYAREDANGGLPDSVWHSALKRLEADEAVATAAVSRRFKRLTLDSSAWLDRYAARWCMSPCVMNPYAAWYSLYKFRRAAEECWRVVCFEVGFRTMRYAMLGGQPAKDPKTGSSNYDHAYSCEPPIINLRQPVARDSDGIGSIPSVIAPVLGHYWSAANGFKHFYVGDAAINQRVRTWSSPSSAPRGAFDSTAKRLPDVEVFGEIFRWTFAFGFEEPCQPAGHPMVIVVPPHLSAAQRAEFAANLHSCQQRPTNIDRSDHFRDPSPHWDLEAPYLLVDNHATLALEGAGQRTGISIHLAELCSVTLVPGAGVALDPVVFCTPEGLGLDEKCLTESWQHSPETGQISALKVSNNETFFAREALTNNIIQAVQKALSGAPGASCSNMVVTCDGVWDADLVAWVQRALSKAFPDLMLAQVKADKVVMMGAITLASSPGGRARFKGVEGLPPLPSTPGLYRC
eukprot:gnl/MRDRNA2_/MRDRNA2_56516_c0_seq1.p1 gnl/MRDRNA2_/MRDRNA2_56516_c0~~gnl/MRDRNA2_/MRDRNA2_56516_c0_seq1.p1  ORF type:complete len:1062 (-),score=173.32 gnl/MRDRNA2_/MRDRNA2_56516_c0_seq1:174-3071(-)